MIKKKSFRLVFIHVRSEQDVALSRLESLMHIILKHILIALPNLYIWISNSLVLLYFTEYGCFPYSTLYFQEKFKKLFTNANVSLDLDINVIEVSKRGIVSKVVPTGSVDKALPVW